jgi:hypothetical protein
MVIEGKLLLLWLRAALYVSRGVGDVTPSTLGLDKRRAARVSSISNLEGSFVSLRFLGFKASFILVPGDTLRDLFD